MGTGYSTLKFIAAGIAATAIASTAHAGTILNTPLVDPPGFYNGSGNPNTNFTVNETAGVELGIGVQNRKGTQVAPTIANVYNVNTGVFTAANDFCLNVCAKWNFEFSVNLRAFDGNAGLLLNQITPTLSIVNIGNGQTITFNPFILDNSGWNGVAAQHRRSDNGFWPRTAEPSFRHTPILNPLFVHPTQMIPTVTLSVKTVMPRSRTVQALIVAGDGAGTRSRPHCRFASGLGVFGFIAARRKECRSWQARTLAHFTDKDRREVVFLQADSFVRYNPTMRYSISSFLFSVALLVFAGGDVTAQRQQPPIQAALSWRELLRQDRQECSKQVDRTNANGFLPCMADRRMPEVGGKEKK